MNWVIVYLIAGALTLGQASYKHACGVMKDPAELGVLAVVALWPLVLPAALQRPCPEVRL